ncbi:MAG TPA: bifunctional UDP-3-O-[3-hydroxymyristoyl] N-acetylglucosamine deacetylase/3-hydroxyacyl-ACP dehydratase [Gemmatimonadaceae bacterium]|nr:bifunctional UDP-3-O-[3-hydroxymyristoyl] N-acetylglucosamine deacetylase/3-hydroxyacyl-ACP dehydratase [Gemmatimonadaceae bacterium]
MTRNTIATETSVEGVGLHLGVGCRLTFKPATAGRGVVFRRTDLANSPEIPATVDAAVLTDRRTQLGHDPVSVHTVEHVLAAVGALEVDDLVIELSGPEPPIADGSAQPFVQALRNAGIARNGGAVQFLTLKQPVEVADGDARYAAYPADTLDLDVTIEFPHRVIGRQQGSYRLSPATFESELAGARTFGFVREVEALRAMGLIKGASTKNAVVLDDDGLVDTTLRWPDEFVRHKALDCVGDLTLAGARVRARVVAHKPSHRGTVQLVRAMRAATAQTHRGGNTNVSQELGVEDIMKVLPHRYPFLLVDRILERDEKRVVGIKNVTINEPFFAGHFPGHPIMPGVLIIEAMAQVGGVLLMGAIPDPQSKVVYFTSLNNVKFRRPVKPGDQLRFELELVQVRGTMARMSGVAKVDGEVVCEGEMGAVVRDR